MNPDLDSPPGSSESFEGDLVDLRVQAHLDLLPVLRTVTEATALLTGLDVDAASDLTLAVDQVCTDLIEDARAGTQLTLRICRVPGRLIAAAAADTRSDAVPTTHGFQWHVAHTLTDAQEVRHTEGPDGLWRTEIELSLSDAR